MLLYGVTQCNNVLLKSLILTKESSNTYIHIIYLYIYREKDIDMNESKNENLNH